MANEPLDLEKANNDQLAWFFFGGLVDRALHERGVPEWLTAAPSKVLHIRANLEAESVKLFGYAGWLTATKDVVCSDCNATIVAGSELYTHHEWEPRCRACEDKAEQQHKQWLAECDARKRETMLKRSAAAKERWRLANQPDPRQTDLFEVKP